MTVLKEFIDHSTVGKAVKYCHTARPTIVDASKLALDDFCFNTTRLSIQSALIKDFSTSPIPRSPSNLFPIVTMESLLSTSFDNLASCDAPKIRKGLRQLEGLLAQICLSNLQVTKTPTAEKRRSVAVPIGREQTPKELAQLKDDAAFREFFKLQEGFEWNGEPASCTTQIGK